MRIGVVGGTGTFGSIAVSELAARGNAVVVLSRHAGQPGRGVVHRRIDLATGEGLPEALSGLEVVVDASNALRLGRAMRAVLVEGTERLLRAEARAGVEHHVLISIVGIESVPFSYYRVKLEQEQRLSVAAVRASVLRSTQFHPLVHGMFGVVSRFGMLPSGGALLQPIDPREVARVLADALEAGPWTEKVEVAGPQILSVSDLARAWMSATGKRRVLVRAPVVGRLGCALRSGALTSQDAIRGELAFGDWVRQSAVRRGGEPDSEETAGS